MENTRTSYIGTKMIEAAPMTNHEYSCQKYGNEKLGNELQEGYKVIYKGGYVSWSPKNVFESAYHKMNIVDIDHLKDLESDLITTNNTYILHDNNTFNAPHNYIIKASKGGTLLAGIHFQEGAMKETNQNGIFTEDLIAICIDRLEHFQDSEYRCRENAVAITKLEESLMWLRKRTLNREKRNVLGKHEV